MATFSQIDTTNNNDTYYEIDEMGKTIMLNDNWFVNIHITHDIIPVFNIIHVFTNEMWFSIGVFF